MITACNLAAELTNLSAFLLPSSTHDRHGRGRSVDRQRRRALMIDRTRQPALAASWMTEHETGHETMSADGDADRARRFREAALPHLDDVYTLARYLMRDVADADDAVQECYLRALRHFDSYRGPAVKPWLLAILRNVCNAEFARRATQPAPSDRDGDERAEELAAAVAGAAALARGGIAPPPGRRNHPPTCRLTAVGIPRGHRAA